MAKNHRGRDIEEIPVPQLYDTAADIGETNDLASQHPEVVDQLLEVARKAREDVGDYNRLGSGARFFDNEPKRPDMKLWIARE